MALLGSAYERRPDLSGNSASFLLLASGWIAWNLAFWMLMRRQGASVTLLMATGIIAKICFLFSIPAFSDDFFRFVWDGRLTLHGLNPFEKTPAEWMQDPAFRMLPDFDSLYHLLNSKNYPSVYPPLLQSCFAAAVWLSPHSVPGAVMILKSCLLLADIVTLWFFLNGRSRSAFALWLLHPLVIFELNGNLHFESFMITGLVGALFFLERKRPVATAFFLGIAAASKLIPILTLPVFLIAHERKQRPVFLIAASVFIVLPFFLFGLIHHLPEWFAGLSLYFRHFEFNAGLYSLMNFLTGHRYHHETGTLLPIVFIALASLVFFKRKEEIRRHPAAAVLIILTGWQLFATTVHPWYITPLVALAAWSGITFPFVWAFLVFFTYSFYFHPTFQSSPALIAFEYLLLLIFIVTEWAYRAGKLSLRHPFIRSIWKATLPLRLLTKLPRILPHLRASERILDIGTGYGALCHTLKYKGFSVCPLDVRDNSLMEDVKPLIFDGVTLPYADHSFDTALLITVLHHTADPDALLKEAGRVAKRVVVMEDVYRNSIQKRITFLMDSLVNLEWKDHPHTNRTESAWRETFSRMGWRIRNESSFRTLGIFRQALWVLETDAG